jgi:hypothetical protein
MLSAVSSPICEYGQGTGCESFTGGAFVPDGVWSAEGVRRRLPLLRLRMRHALQAQPEERRWYEHQPAGFNLMVKGEVRALTTFVSWEGYLLSVFAPRQIYNRSDVSV